MRRPGFRPPQIQNATYIFVDNVIASSVMNKTITRDPRYAPRMKNGLLALPSVSLIVPGQPGYEEQEGSVEIFWPDGSAPAQANCGVARFGGSYEEFAKKVSGPMPLAVRRQLIKTPLFNGFEHGVPPPGHPSTSSNSAPARQDMVERGFYMAGPFVQDSMMDLRGDLNPHGRFVHVYLNGVYWGQYDARGTTGPAFSLLRLPRGRSRRLRRCESATTTSAIILWWALRLHRRSFPGNGCCR